MTATYVVQKMPRPSGRNYKKSVRGQKANVNVVIIDSDTENAFLGSVTTNK